jgi:hypothetical protein
MKRLAGALFAAAVAVLPIEANAQTATTYQLTDSASTPHQVHGFTCITSLLCLAQVPTDFNGNPFGVTGNPFFVSPASGATFPVSAASLPLPSGAATSASQTSQIAQETATNTNLGAPGTAPCASPTTSCSINQMLALIAQTAAANQTALNNVLTALGTLNTTAAGPATLAAAATGGATPGHILSAASNNATNIKASAGTLSELSILQTTTTLMDVRLYDTATTPTCSSATGVVANYVVQSNAVSPGMTIPLGPFGKAFVNGIGICITGANADNDNTSAVTGLNVNYSFK